MHTENDIIPTAIEILRNAGGVCTTGELVNTVKEILPLDAEDLEILPSGMFPRIDQIVRNLKCNKTLEKLGIAEYFDGGFMLTEEGQTMPIETIKENIKTIQSNELSLQQCMVNVVKKHGFVFVKSMEAASEIRKQFPPLQKIDNDYDRLNAVTTVVQTYVENHPENVKH